MSVSLIRRKPFELWPQAAIGDSGTVSTTERYASRLRSLLMPQVQAKQATHLRDLAMAC